MKPEEKQGVTFIACRRGADREKCRCGNAVTIQCDFPLTGDMTGKTCDRGLCARCRIKIGDNLDYCGAHHRMSVKAGTLPRRR